MKMNRKPKLLKKVVQGIVLGGSTLLAQAAFAASGFNTFLLPTPDNNTNVYTCTSPDVTGASREALCVDYNDGGTIGPVAIAFRYDEIFSYSAGVLKFIQDNTSYFPESEYGDLAAPGAGQGSEDVVVYTNSGGTSNDNVGPEGQFDLEDPAATPTGASADSGESDAWWGQDDATNDGVADNAEGPVTVGELEDYLTAFDPQNKTPVLLADYSQTGSDSFLLASGAIYIIDPNFAGPCLNTAPNISAQGCIVETFALDTLNDGLFDPTAQTLNFKEIPLPGGSTLSILGSGQYDFYLLPVITSSPTAKFYELFDISDYNDDHLFVVRSVFGCIDGRAAGGVPNPFDPTETVGCQNNGPERVFLSGRQIASLPPVVVPAPASLALLSIGLLGLGFAVRRNRKLTKFS